jgi:1,2-phenylacetyl-CoA epoxidase catalytic subunit
VLYEAADQLRLEHLKGSSDADVAGLAAKIDREEVYHRMHAQMWAERLADEPRYRDAIEELFPHALGVVEPKLRPAFAERFGQAELDAVERGTHVGEWPALWEEMTMVRRAVPGATW